MNSVLQKLHLKSEGSKNENLLDEPASEDLQKLRDQYEKAGQGHVFKFYEHLSQGERAALYERLSSIDPEYINWITAKVLNPPKHSDESVDLAPLPESCTASTLDANAKQTEEWYQSGLESIAAGHVAVVLMAGGQGTRLGSSDPKGCFNIGLPSGKSLFQMQAERIRRIQQLARRKNDGKQVSVPWYVMTSGPTRKATESFFQDHKHFGLDPQNIVIFEQGILPCISNNGKILMESKGKVAVAPDGNGGIYQALQTSNIIADMRKRGIEHVHAYCVDNCLVRVADPVFIGFAASKKVDIATKVVRKRNAKESVGLILQKNGKPDVVEYSEIDSETAEAKDAHQHDLLKFRAANIVNHYYSFDFLDNIPQWAHKLPYHMAKKKIPCIDFESGNTIKPDKPNGIKLEQFVFDVFPMLDLDKFACLEVHRADEFSPLKNAKGTGEDDPDTSKCDVLNQGKRWLEAIGATVVSEQATAGVEVSPLISYGGENLESFKDKTIRAPAVIEKEQ